MFREFFQFQLTHSWVDTKKVLENEYFKLWFPEVKLELDRRCREVGMNESERAMKCIDLYNLTRGTLFSVKGSFYWWTNDKKDYLGCNMTHCRSKNATS